MIRGKIDLSSHKLYGLYRSPVRCTKRFRKRMPKMPGGTKGAYKMLWVLVDGAVRDTFERHPDYLTAKGRDSAIMSVNKRVTGAIFGYVTQVAQCRSVEVSPATRTEADALPNLKLAEPDAAADMNAGLCLPSVQPPRAATRWFGRIFLRASGLGGGGKSSPEIHSKES